MADKKISELDAITGANTAADDYFVVVDTSGSVTKKISRAELNNAIEQDVLSTVDINGGTIDNTVIGGTTPAAGSFTNVTASGTVDGRDVSVDGAKLDGIEASADVTDATNVAAAGALMTAGGTMTGDINFGTNDKAIFGSGNDLSVFHDGSHGYVSDAGTGNLQLSTNGTAIKMLRGNGEVLSSFNIGGSVDLYHSNAKKFETTATGVDVTGTAKSDIFQIDAGSAPTWDTSTRLWTESGFGARYDGYQHRFDVGVGRTQAMTINASGKVGIGTSSPPQKFVVSNAGADNIVMSENSSASIQMFMQATSGTGSVGTLTNHDVQFLANNSEKMRVSSNGSLGVGSTLTTAGVVIEAQGTNGWNLNTVVATTAGIGHIVFSNGNGVVGSIVTSGTATAYNTASDYRLKENATTITNATDRLKQLNPVRFNFIADADTTVDGFIAHEVATVIPEAISGEKDEVDADGNAVMQGIDQSKLVPLLTAAMQEALTKIDQLETRITALEA